MQNFALMNQISDIKIQLLHYKKKFYLNQLIKSSVWFVMFLISIYITISVLEYFFWFNSLVRTILFSISILLFSYFLAKNIVLPLFKFINADKHLSDEEAAKAIGVYFPEISDKLLNTLQLSALSQETNAFIAASINQKIATFKYFKFDTAINFKVNKKYLQYAFILLIFTVLGIVFLPAVFSDSAERVLLFQQKFAKPAPFQFQIQNKSLSVFRNEDFTLKVKLTGSAIPENIFIIHGANKIKLLKEGEVFEHTFISASQNIDFVLEGAGFESIPYQLQVLDRSSLVAFDLEAEYPAYTGKKAEKLENVGSLTVPEGTSLTWKFATTATNSLNINFSDFKKSISAEKFNDNNFIFKKLVEKSFQYELKLQSESLENKEKIAYSIAAIPDQYPSIDLAQHKDSSLFTQILLAGNIADDYGISKLNLVYKVGKENQKSIAIPIKKNQSSQSFFYNWNIENLNLKAGEKLEYFVQVFDNDGFRGPKSAKSQIFELQVPKEKELAKEIAENASKSDNMIDKTLSEAKELQKSIKQLEEKLKGKKQLSWQDKKQFQDLIEKKENLMKQLENTKNQANKSLEKMEKFDPKVSEEIKQKSDELQKLISELLDEKTKEMLKEMQKMLEEKKQDEQVRQAIEDFKKNEEDLAKDLEKTLERFRQLQFENKLNKNIDDLNKLAQQQKDLAKKPKNEENLKQQQELNKKFEETKKNLDDLQKTNQDLENKHELGNLDEQKENISQEMQKSEQQLGKNQPSKAQKSQQNAAEKMQEMANQMAKMQQQEAEENIADMRKLLENLLHLSFEQESLMKNFKNVNLNDPRYVQLSRAQLKLSTDAKIVEDSLQALAKRVFQIKQFVTKELGLMNDYMQEASDAIKAKKPYEAAGKQQFAMTSMNNLALMLSDVVKQMQMQAAQQKKPGQGSCSKPGGKNPKPSLSQMQKSLNEQMQQLGKNGKGGKQMSEELAKMAARQEMIRNALKEMQKGLEEGGKKAGGNLGKMAEEMEKTEEDILNNNITQQTIDRQKEILTRLLEVEKSDREQDMEEKREAQTANQFNQEIPAELKKYMQQKQKQLELYKTTSPGLTPFYKQEVGDYFKKLEN